MLVIIVGDGGSGKTYFRNNLMSRIPGYNPNLKTDVKLEPDVGDAFDPTPHNTIIETRNHLNSHRNIRLHADFVVFTSKNAFYTWFLNETNGDFTINSYKERIKAIEFTFGHGGSYPHIVYDRAEDKMCTYSD